MRKVFLGLFFVVIMVFASGCGASNNSADSAYTSFLGVSLGDSKITVDANLGTATYIGATTDGVMIAYSYASGSKFVSYIDGKVIAIGTASSSYSLNGIKVGDTGEKVRSVFGSPSSIGGTSSSPTWYYVSKNLVFSIDYLGNIGLIWVADAKAVEEHI